MPSERFPVTVVPEYLPLRVPPRCDAIESVGILYAQGPGHGESISRKVIIQDLTPGGFPVSRDPDDDRILACTSVSQADSLVTGDEDLLVVRQYGATKILSPRDFESLFGD